jgi:hypothetical protein
MHPMQSTIQPDPFSPTTCGWCSLRCVVFVPVPVLIHMKSSMFDCKCNGVSSSVGDPNPAPLRCLPVVPIRKSNFFTSTFSILKILS